VVVMGVSTCPVIKPSGVSYQEYYTSFEANGASTAKSREIIMAVVCLKLLQISRPPCYSTFFIYFP
jgi:hypothetical protein